LVKLAIIIDFLSSFLKVGAEKTKHKAYTSIHDGGFILLIWHMYVGTLYIYIYILQYCLSEINLIKV